MIEIQSTKEAEIAGVCTSLDLPVSEVGWGAGADAAACLNLQSCQCSG